MPGSAKSFKRLRMLFINRKAADTDKALLPSPIGLPSRTCSPSEGLSLLRNFAATGLPENASAPHKNAVLIQRVIMWSKGMLMLKRERLNLRWAVVGANFDSFKEAIKSLVEGLLNLKRNGCPDVVPFISGIWPMGTRRLAIIINMANNSRRSAVHPGIAAATCVAELNLLKRLTFRYLVFLCLCHKSAVLGSVSIADGLSAGTLITGIHYDETSHSL